MKSTKKALFTSILCLLLCVSMLIGTTFAWFTDTVQSGINQIVAGNLDVELYRQSGHIEEEKVTENTDNLFKDVTLWEPGAYAYETFTVKNVGTLALKYKMALNVANFTSYNGHNLTEVLKVATLENVPTSRADITGGTALKDWSLNSDNVTLYPVGAGDDKPSEKTFTVAVYWEPTDHDNDFNMNNGRPQPLSVDLGIQLVATQVEYESDSFDNLYDKETENTLDDVTAVETAIAVVEAGAPTSFTVNVTPATTGVLKTTVDFEADALAPGEYVLNVETENHLFNITSENGVAATIDLKLFKDEALVENFAEGKAATITTYISKGLTLVSGQEVVYTGTDGKDQPEFVSYDPATGELVFKTNHFSEYVANHNSTAYSKLNDTAYDTAAAAVAAAVDKDTVVLFKSVDENIVVSEGKNITLDLNGVTINGKKVNQSPAVTNKGTLVITDTSKAGTGKIMREDKNGDAEPYYVIDNQGVMTIKKANVYNEAKNSTGGATLIRSGIGASPALTINDGTFINKNYAVVKNEEGSLTINGGVFDSGIQYTTVQIYGNAVLNGGSFIGITKEKSGTLVTNGGNFKYIPSYVGADSFMIIDKSKTFAESYQYQVRLNGNEPTEYDAKVVKDTGAVTFYIGKTHAEGANSAQEAHAAGYTVYYNYAPTNVKKLGNGSFYAWYKDGIVKDGHYSADAGYEVLSETNAETGIVRYYTAITENTAIAKIVRNSENLYFSSVVNAARAAQAGETIVVLKDDSATSRVVGSTNVPDRISVDLNGKTVAGVLTSNKDNKSITVVDSVGGGVATNYVNNYLDTASLTIKGGTFTNYIFAQKGTITIEGGYFKGDLAEKQYNNMGSDSNGGELVIKGGTFEKNPSDFVAVGYAATDNGNNTWTVTKVN